MASASASQLALEARLPELLLCYVHELSSSCLLSGYTSLRSYSTFGLTEPCICCISSVHLRQAFACSAAAEMCVSRSELITLHATGSTQQITASPKCMGSSFACYSALLSMQHQALRCNILHDEHGAGSLRTAACASRDAGSCTSHIQQAGAFTWYVYRRYCERGTAIHVGKCSHSSGHR